MAKTIYYRLRDRLDEYSLGFRATESGVEIKILEKLFTEEEAEIYLHLAIELQTAKEIADKTARDPDDVERVLRTMTGKGLTFPRFPKKEGEPVYYAAAPYMHGILEHQAYRWDKEAAELFEGHFQAGSLSRGPVGLRNIPINEAVNDTLTVAPYDDVRAIIHRKKRIALTDCGCSMWQRARGMVCHNPVNVCMLFDFYADYYVEMGWGRLISPEEALETLALGEKHGLVPGLSNSEDPEALCNCCPRCCGLIRGIKRSSRPAAIAASCYFAVVDSALCTGCETCVERCPMEAVGLGDAGSCVIDLDRCIGCGLCVSTCPEKAVRLQRKPEERIRPPMKTSRFMRPSAAFEDDVRGHENR